MTLTVRVARNAFEFYNVLSPHCTRIVLANPSALKRLDSRRHTDKVDAARLAQDDGDERGSCCGMNPACLVRNL
ncbi:MAG TPA: hypothetical protein GX510_08765 [Firmicutes bacterium]|nr:hypothetical protein [Candidatus Fermentithermobacillaceae bacterium]